MMPLPKWIVLDFQRGRARKFSNPDDKVKFQAKLYEKIGPETSKAIIAETYHPNRAMNGIITSANLLPISILRRNEIDTYII